MRLSPTLRVVRLVRKRAGMPDFDDRHRVADNSMEKAVRGDGKLAVRKLREFRNRMARVRAKLGDDRLRAPLNAGRSPVRASATEVMRRRNRE
jgi:hypothetical protein